MQTTTLSAQESIWQNSSNYGFTIGADWLYWTARQEGLTAGSFVDDFPDPTLKNVRVHTLDPGFEYESGFRVNAGYQFPCSCWEVGVNYTYLPIKSTSVSAIAGGMISDTHRQFIPINTADFPITQILVSADFLTSLLADWSGNLSYIDADLARTLQFGRSFHLSPHVGFRALWMKQRYFIEGDLEVPSLNNSTFLVFNSTQQLNAYGIESGLWAGWDLGWGISILGHFGGSILSSDFDVHQKIDGLLGSDGPVVLDGQLHSNNLQDMNPTLDFFLGIEYCFPICCTLITLNAGWEQHTFFNFNQFAALGGNFCTEGLTLGLNVDF